MGKMKVLKFKLLHKNSILPSYSHPDDAGFNLYSIEKIKIKPGEYKKVFLGIAAEIPRDCFVSFRGRSSLAAEYGIDVLGGVIDSGYRGEWICILINHGKKSYQINIGDKIAQGILQPAKQIKIIKTKILSETKRGNKGFGSTGK
jgi:dUTP pyrophosphatase